jgi:hypothetical protein
MEFSKFNKMNVIRKINISKLCMVLTVLGVYSASMYKIAETRTYQTQIIDMPLTTQADADKIREVVKPRMMHENASQYLPGVACVIDAGEDVTPAMMEEFFTECVASHGDFISHE